MSALDRTLVFTRFLAACCVLAAALAFGGVGPLSAARDGGCSNSTSQACATNGGATADRKCDSSEGCTTCDYKAGHTCYHGDGPHIQNFYDGDGGIG